VDFVLKNTIYTKIKKFITEQPARAEIIYWIFFVLALASKCIYFQFGSLANAGEPIFSAGNITMFFSTLAILLVIVAITLLIFNKYRLYVLLVYDILLTILFMADTNFFRYYYNALPIPIIYQVNFGVVNSVQQSITSLFQPKDVFYFLDFPFMVFGLIMLVKTKRPKLQLRKKFSYIGVLAAVGLSILCTTYFTSGAYSLPNNNSYIIRNLGVLFFHYNDAKSFVKNTVFTSEEVEPEEKAKVDEYYKNKEKTPSNYRGVAKGKNLIMVQMEAMQQFVINKKINGWEITPNLNKLIKESMYFDNFYYQVAGGNTSDAEFLTNTSMYPAYEGAVYHIYPENTYYTLPKAMSAMGYQTYVLHAFEPTFWNRQEMYKAIGYDKFLSGNDFIKDDFAGWDGTTLSDASFFRQSLEKIDTSKPFYSFLITLSSHHPFTAFADYEFDDFDVGEYEGTYMGNYLKAAHYADSCLGQFIDDLKKRGLYDNSLLVLYGDHSAVPKMESEDLYELVGQEYSDYTWQHLQKVPLIIHCSGFKNGEVIHTIGGEIDVSPTIANLMGFDLKHAFGKDLLNTEKGYVIRRDGTIVTDEYTYISSTKKVYRTSDGEELDYELYKKDIESRLNELAVSDIILTKDLFKNYTIPESEK